MIDSRRQVTQEDLNAGVWTSLSDTGQGFTALSFNASVTGTAVNGEPINTYSLWQGSIVTHATIEVGGLFCEKSSFRFANGDFCA